MAQQTINNGETGLVVRDKINDNITELYSVPHDKKRTGDTTSYASNAMNALAPTTQALATNSIRAHAFRITETITVTEIVSEVTSVIVVSTYRLGIYTDNGNGYPDALVANSDTGTYDSTTLLAKTGVFAANIVLTPGIYWLAANSNLNPQLRSVNAAAQFLILGVNPALGGAAPRLGWLATLTYAAMPSTFPAGATVNSNIFGTLIGLKTI